MDNQPSKSMGNPSKEARPERKHLTDLDQIVQRHLHDEHDKITEEDIRDVVIGFPEKTSGIRIELPKDNEHSFPAGRDS